MDGLVGGQEGWGDFAVGAGPVKKDFLVFGRQVIGGVRSADILLDAAGRIAEEKTLEALGIGGFVDGGVVEAVLVRPEVTGSQAENGLSDFLACLNRSPDLFDQQVHLPEQGDGVVSDRFFPSAQGL